MTLADGMRPLVQHLSEASHARRAAVADLRASTAESRHERAQYVADLRHTTADFVQELHAAHQNLSADVGWLRQEAASFVQATGQETRERLDEMMAALRHDTAEFLEELEPAREAMADEQRQRLGADHAELTRSTAVARKARQADLSELTRNVAAERGATQADLQEARRLWRSIPALNGKKPRAKREAAAEPKAAAEPAVKRPDDLTEIPGVGPTMQRRLQKAGIATFAQLAKATPAKLREALGDGVARAKAEDWIAQARDLAGR